VKKVDVLRELAIVKAQLHQLISDPRFYGVDEPGLTKLKYVYSKIATLLDALTGADHE
jgi:hypothetical protein